MVLKVPIVLAAAGWLLVAETADPREKYEAKMESKHRPFLRSWLTTRSSRNSHSAEEGTLGVYRTRDRREGTGTKSSSTRPFERLPSDGKPTRHINMESRKTSQYAGQFTDPMWKKQWYVHDYRTIEGPVMDLNVVPVYRKQVTGKGVTVAVVDVGVNHNNPDLKKNYALDLSYDVLLNKGGAMPEKTSMMDRLNPWKHESHGSKAAGVIGMEANNGVCGVGIAYEARIIGVRCLGPGATTYTNSKALSHRLEDVDIYSNSWGPTDDGKTMGHMNDLIRDSLLDGVLKGRGGKGAVYVFAGGNGKAVFDNCAADEYVNSPQVIGIAAASPGGKRTTYSEPCAAIFATTYAQAKGNTIFGEAVVSTDGDGNCIKDFGWTSAAAPQASGIIALVLQANPSLTYRDVMHLITMSAEVAPLADNAGSWRLNGAGFWVSNDFGFGLMNAENMVDLAISWSLVPEFRVCHEKILLPNPENIFSGKVLRVPFTVTGCEGTADAVEYLEQLGVTITVSHEYRGAVLIDLYSPTKTYTKLLDSRKYDSNRNGFTSWTFKSVHNWGEDPKGEWIIEFRIKKHWFKRMVEAVTDLFKPKAEGCNEKSVGCVHKLTLTMQGTRERPNHHDLLPRTYAAFRLPSGETSYAD